MPATTTMASAPTNSLAVPQQAMDARDAHVGDQLHVAAQRLRGDDRLLRHRQIAGPRRDDHDPAQRSAGAAAAGSQNVRATRSCWACGKCGRRCGGLLVADARGQAILAGLDELADDAFDPFRRLALAEDHFGKAAALAALEIDVGVAQVDLHGFIQACQSAVDAQCSRRTCSSISRKSPGSMTWSSLPGKRASIL